MADDSESDRILQNIPSPLSPPPPPSDPKPSFWKQFTWDDVVVAVVVHSVAEPINIAAGEAFVNLQTGREWVGWAYGIPLAIIGTTFHWWKQWILPASVPAWIGRNGGWFIFIAFLVFSGALFTYVAGPRIYQRATASRPGAITPAPAPSFSDNPLHDDAAKWRIARYLRPVVPRIAGNNRGICEAVIVRYQTPWAENLASDIKEVFDTIGWKYHEVFAESAIPKNLSMQSVYEDIPRGCMGLFNEQLSHITPRGINAKTGWINEPNSNVYIKKCEGPCFEIDIGHEAE